MYQRSDYPCPQCFRLLRRKLNDVGFYCPDQLHCCWENEGKPPSISTANLREQLQIAQENHDQVRKYRINVILNRR